MLPPLLLFLQRAGLNPLLQSRSLRSVLLCGIGLVVCRRWILLLVYLILLSALNAALEQAPRSLCVGATSDIIQTDLRHLKSQIAAAFVTNNEIPEWLFSVSITE